MTDETKAAWLVVALFVAVAALVAIFIWAVV
jgi:hypothetical protein